MTAFDILGSEFGIRAAVFFSAATVSGAFGGLLAAAISKMEGIGGKPAWVSLRPHLHLCSSASRPF